METAAIVNSVVDRIVHRFHPRRVLSDLPVSKDIIVSTPEELERRGRLPGTVLFGALLDAEVAYEQS